MSLKLSFLILAMLIFITGCQQQTSRPSGIVAANPTYMKHFGDPPLKTKSYAEGSTIHAQWNVTDTLGRSNMGKRTFHLEKRVH